MKKESLNEILYSVFVEDTSAFRIFLESEQLYAITCLSSEKEKILAEIDNQLEYVFKRLKTEGATHTPSKTTEFLNIMKHTYNK